MTPLERDALGPRELAVWAAVYAVTWDHYIGAKRRALNAVNAADCAVEQLRAHEHPTEEKSR